MSHLDGLQSLGECTDLIELDQNGVRGLLLDPSGNPARIGYKKIVPHDLDPISQLFRHVLPGLPVVFSKAVFNGENRIALHPVFPECDHVRRAFLGSVGLKEHIFSLLEKRGAGWIKGQDHIFARLVSGFLDRCKDHFNSLVVGFQIRSESSFIAHGRRQSLVFQHSRQGMKNFHTDSKGLLEGFSAYRHDHELLEVHIVCGVKPSIEDIHHGHGEAACIDAAQVAIQRHAQRVRRSPGDCQ